MHEDSLFSPRNVTCIFVFRADLLVFDNQLLYPFLGKTASSLLSILLLPVVLCVEFTPILYTLSIVAIFVLLTSEEVLLVLLYGCNI